MNSATQINVLAGQAFRCDRQFGFGTRLFSAADFCSWIYDQARNSRNRAAATNEVKVLRVYDLFGGVVKYLFNQMSQDSETSRHAAFADARRAAGIPGSAVPSMLDPQAHLYDGNRANPRYLFDKDGKPLLGRVYSYDVNGRAVVIQEHSVGHMQKNAEGKWIMQEKGHFNVRDANGNTLPGTKPHYEFKWRVDPMKYFWRRGGGGFGPRGGDQ
jgi:hypothetical protein